MIFHVTVVHGPHGSSQGPPHVALTLCLPEHASDMETGFAGSVETEPIFLDLDPRAAPGQRLQPSSSPHARMRLKQKTSTLVTFVSVTA